MTRVFTMDLNRIQPSQLFINAAKLAQVLQDFIPQRSGTIEPIPIKRLGTQVIFTDGHTRALAVFLQGINEVPVYWDEDDLDWEAYAICVRWCKKEGIHTIADLTDRVVKPEEYKVLWYERCRKMHQALEKKRRQR